MKFSTWLIGHVKNVVITSGGVGQVSQRVLHVVLVQRPTKPNRPILTLFVNVTEPL